MNEIMNVYNVIGNPSAVEGQAANNLNLWTGLKAQCSTCLLLRILKSLWRVSWPRQEWCYVRLATNYFFHKHLTIIYSTYKQATIQILHFFIWEYYDHCSQLIRLYSVLKVFRNVFMELLCQRARNDVMYTTA